MVQPRPNPPLPEHFSGRALSCGQERFEGCQPLTKRINRSCIRAGMSMLFVLFLFMPARGQTGQYWPEINFYRTLDSNSRFHFITTLTRENGESTEIEVGGDLDFYFKPLVKLRRFGGRQVDESKSMPLLLRVGYHYLPSTQGSNEHRVIIEATPRIPLKAGAVISSRNRVDFRFINDEFSWRYRNRLTIERTFNARSFEFSPYVRAEVYYDHKVTKWSRTTFSGGVTIPLGKHYEIEAYYEHQNDTSKSPNRQVNALGSALNLHF